MIATMQTHCWTLFHENQNSSQSLSQFESNLLAVSDDFLQGNTALLFISSVSLCGNRLTALSKWEGGKFHGADGAEKLPKLL